jgi:hypothetical protein
MVEWERSRAPAAARYSVALAAALGIAVGICVAWITMRLPARARHMTAIGARR